jgi:hypothetical protein
MRVEVTPAELDTLGDRIRFVRSDRVVDCLPLQPTTVAKDAQALVLGGRRRGVCNRDRHGFDARESRHKLHVRGRVRGRVHERLSWDRNGAASRSTPPATPLRIAKV